MSDKKSLLIAVAHRRGVALVDLAIGAGGASVRASLDLSGAIGLARISGSLFALVDDAAPRVIKLDDRLSILNEKKLRSAGSIAADDARVCLGADGALIVLDPKLAELGRAALIPDWPLAHDKNAHDIMLHGDTAYLLDNIEQPVYVFRVDIAHPANPRIVERREWSDTYAHLSAQWLVPDENKWLVAMTVSGMFGEEHRLYEFGPDLPDGKLQYFTNFRRMCAPYSDSGALEIEGLPVLGVLPGPPAWSVTRIARHDESAITGFEYGLIKWWLDGESLERSPEIVPVPSFNAEGFSATRFIMRRCGDIVAIAPYEGRLLAIAVCGDTARILPEANLQDIGIDAITDITILG